MHFEIKDINHLVFENTSSTMSELKTIKYVLEFIDNKQEEYNKDKKKIYLYTDCMNFINLITKRKNKENLKAHINYELYNTLINLVAKNKVNVIWVKGHNKKILKIEKYQKIFSIIDKQTRKLLRNSIKKT